MHLRLILSKNAKKQNYFLSVSVVSPFTQSTFYTYEPTFQNTKKKIFNYNIIML